MAPIRPPIYSQAVRFVLDVANRRSPLSKLVPVALLALDAVLCCLIIWKIPYTEIDWVAYMEQVGQFVAGERDYTQMKGGTGPLVYPGAHVYTYSVLYYLTDQGSNILLAQQIFAGLYLFTLAVVMRCYWQAGAPPYVLPLLVLSKRLHSIYILRCFNDGFAALFLWLAILLLQQKRWTLGALAYSWGLGIKMSLLLGLPAVGVVLFLGRGFVGALRAACLMAQLQIALAVPFLAANPAGYLGRAFELSRQFFFRWTVNWRFVGEARFLSRPFAFGLLALHAALLAVFATTRWLRPTGRSPASLVHTVLASRRLPFTDREERLLARSAASPRYIATTVLTANVVGLLAARSLHYQFYAYLAWATPYLLWRSGAHPLVQYGLWALQEWAWNVFPSTPLSSAVVVGILAVTVALTWWGATDEYRQVLPLEKDEAVKRKKSAEM
ncbi:alpha-mannosyltransferase [Grosmannia clavigera kw1407]|uniref:Dol-P-Man:Man(5)GlcNAc(2)-PP-Dol alpha-1,3-mannosyltransferase n=1 Tax=Grosmannia clavigera (strain kw1407 / UAMH 11150) TaxID=655863 RepID=F0X8A8_GROCL|nr:alpha-mannosyltransferase [Grosmannia clavigera kw1407]EFX05650.1 alpha-mannosyltransferase [Grosmannia clavigera kw1407]